MFLYSVDDSSVDSPPVDGPVGILKKVSCCWISRRYDDDDDDDPINVQIKLSSSRCPIYYPPEIPPADDPFKRFPVDGPPVDPCWWHVNSCPADQVDGPPVGALLLVFQ